MADKTCKLCGKTFLLTTKTGGNSRIYCFDCLPKGQPWKAYGIKYSTYILRLETGTPFTQRRRQCGQRASGKKYDNPPEKLEAIKKKYANGVTREMIAEMVERII